MLYPENIKDILDKKVLLDLHTIYQNREDEIYNRSLLFNFNYVAAETQMKNIILDKAYIPKLKYVKINYIFLGEIEKDRKPDYWIIYERYKLLLNNLGKYKHNEFEVSSSMEIMAEIRKMKVIENVDINTIDNYVDGINNIIFKIRKFINSNEYKFAEYAYHAIVNCTAVDKLEILYYEMKNKIPRTEYFNKLQDLYYFYLSKASNKFHQINIYFSNLLSQKKI